jgi:hypothetical protein
MTFIETAGKIVLEALAPALAKRAIASSNLLRTAVREFSVRLPEPLWEPIFELPRLKAIHGNISESSPDCYLMTLMQRGARMMEPGSLSDAEWLHQLPKAVDLLDDAWLSANVETSSAKIGKFRILFLQPCFWTEHANVLLIRSKGSMQKTLKQKPSFDVCGQS